MASFLKKFVKDRSKSPQKRILQQNGFYTSRQSYIPQPYAPVCYLPLPPSPVPYQQQKKHSSSRSNESFGIHSWNTEPREIDDVFLGGQKSPTEVRPPSPGPLMRTRSHSPRKLKRESNDERKLKSKSKSPQKRTGSSTTVINQLDYLNSQCHLEGCRADIVVTSTRFMLCRHQLCHASVYFKDLLAGNETNKDYHITVTSMSDPSPSTQFRWFVESCIPCPALKDITDETLETCMRLSQRFQANGLQLRCTKFLIENANNRQPIVALCWLNWVLKHNFDAQTQAALLPSVSRLSLNSLQRHRHMITEHIYSDIITAKLRATYDKTVQVFLAIHKIDHFTADLDICPRCKRTKDGMKLKVHCDPCRKQIGCDRCYQEGCEISSRAVEDLQAFFKCPHGLTPINDTTDDCHCQIQQLAQHLGNQPSLRYQENNDDYMMTADHKTRNERKSRKKQPI